MMRFFEKKEKNYIIFQDFLSELFYHYINLFELTKSKINHTFEV